VRCIGEMPERHRVSGNALVSRPSARLGAPFLREVPIRAREPGPRGNTMDRGYCASRVSRWVPALAEFTLGPREARTRGSAGTRERRHPKLTRRR
jgi:hypothetical protein